MAKKISGAIGGTKRPSALLDSHYVKVMLDQFSGGTKLQNYQ